MSVDTSSVHLPSGMEKNIRLGSGVIVGVLGSGGMSKVYKIWNKKLELFRAVKILYPNKKADFYGRFATESKISAQLQHPNIIEIHDYGEWHGLPYIEMELLDGISLRKITQKYGRLPALVATSLGIQIIRALDYAHNQPYTLYNKSYKGIIHRDLKPENIIVSRNGFLKIMDFGVARPSEVGLHTRHGFIVGTLQYLPPELFEGENVDYSADLYSFGAILYEMLIGKMTFPQKGFENLLKVKLSGSYRRIKEFHYPISPALVNITEKCLHSNREKRFTNARDLHERFNTILKSMTKRPPEKILEQFLNDPIGYVTEEHSYLDRSTLEKIGSIKTKIFKKITSSSRRTVAHITSYGQLMLERQRILVRYIFYTLAVIVSILLVMIGVVTFMSPKKVETPISKAIWNENVWNEMIFE